MSYFGAVNKRNINEILSNPVNSSTMLVQPSSFKVDTAGINTNIAFLISFIFMFISVFFMKKEIQNV